MFNRIIAFALEQRLLVIVLAALLTAYGLFAIKSLPVDVFPDLNRPTVTIMTEAHGLAPEEVETLITLPIETSMNGATGVERVRSASSIGFSIVWVEFGWETQTYTARQIVSEKLQQVTAQFPKDVKSSMGPISSIMGEIMLIGMTSENPDVSPLDLRSIADWEVRQRLLALPGIAQVTVIGGDQKQFQVLIDPRKLQYYGLSLRDIEEALEKANVNSTGGFELTANNEYLIRNLGRIQTLDDLADSVIPKTISHEAPALTLRQVADIRLGGPLAKRGDASVSGKPGVILSIQKQPGADTIALTNRVNKELQSIRATLPKGVAVHDDLFRQSIFIENAIKNIKYALRDGAIMVAIILFVFLLNVRTTLITLTAIPVSLLMTAIVFKYFGLTINTMTLGGLAVAIGELVDDAIVDVENVYRRLRENRKLVHPRPPLEVIYQASAEVRNSIVFATIIIVLVFLPLFAMSGIEGKIFLPLGIAYIVSIIASLFVSLTLTPVLCSYLLPRMKQMHEHRDGWLVSRLKHVETSALHFALPRTKPIMGIVLAAFLLAAGSAAFLGREFLPEFNEGSVTISMVSAPGTSLEESNRMGVIAEELMLQVPEVSKTGRRTGRAELDEHAMGVNASEIEVELHDKGRNRAEILREIRDKLSTIPGVVINIGQPISHRIDHMLSGVRAQIAIKLFGEDLEIMRQKAKEIEAMMKAVPGVVDLQSETQIMIPQIHVRLDREQAKKHAVMVGDVAEYAELALQGKAVTQIVDGRKVYDVVMRLDDKSRENRDAIGEIPVDTLRGNLVPLGLVADILPASGPNVINRENVSRRMVIQANVAERDLVSTVQEIQKSIGEKVQLPPGYFITYGGQFESQKSASAIIGFLSLLSFLGMFIVLFSHFKSVSLAVQVMIAIPLAFIGAVAGIYLTGGVFSIATLIGFITLTGIAARNGIMMISHYLHLMKHEGEKFDLAMLIRGTNERLVPVLMTALTAALALVPLILAGNEPGKEILHPVAVVIFSGLFSSTVLNLIVTPLLFWHFGRKSVTRLIPESIQPNLTQGA